MLDSHVFFKECVSNLFLEKPKFLTEYYTRHQWSRSGPRRTVRNSCAQFCSLYINLYSSHHMLLKICKRNDDEFLQVFVYLLKPLLGHDCLRPFLLMIMSSISCCVFYAFVLMYDIGIKFDMI